ncbi:nitric oxide synthase oxygenase [Actinomadura formosensis]|uniref:nitric oxide synthase oxygenase n=1 Tax=Actinomadura formosensis TaxID=60706 RepID=UPI000A02938F|nr:nitric oxide synthase oxygenase [Actinomadura formosensis]
MFESTTRRRTVEVQDATEFLHGFFEENPRLREDREKRIRFVAEEIERTGTYRHTKRELVWGARAAWRNASKCIGRFYWQSLHVRDRRDLRTGEEIAEQCFEHLRSSWRGGRLRPMITIFAPDTPDGPTARILNDQLVRYAGYEAADGTLIGDGQYLEITRLAESLGWRGSGGRFDVLPLLVETGEGLSAHQLPTDALKEVEIVHPEFSWFSELGLRWHAIPTQADMTLEVGGVHYGAAPFNGWYLSTEIGARNLVDRHRYDVLPEIGRRMRLDMSSERTLWRDRAMIELNRAVLHSYDSQGVTITDHHTESRRFIEFVEREERSGRTCPADWSWIVPPVSGGLTPVYHRYYDEAELCPRFVRDPGRSST